MNTASKYIFSMVAALVLLTLGFVAGRWLENGSASQITNRHNAGTDDKTVLYWYDPMYPQQRFDQPGKSPFMDMELVPRYANDDAAAEIHAGIGITPLQRQNLGIRFAATERTALPWTVSATGLLAFNDRDVVVEQFPVDGLVERVWPMAVGDRIAAGQPLLEVRSPDWLAAQQEWLALRAHGDATLQAAALQRLQQLGMPAAAIIALQRHGKISESVVVPARRSGVIQQLDVRAGMRLMPGQTLLRINGLDTVWLDVAIPEAQAAGLSLRPTALTAIASLTAFPGDSFAGSVIAVLPMLDEASRSLRLRVELSNRDGRLRPGMTAQVTVQQRSESTTLTVPTEAVIRTGQRALVMVHKQDRFQPVEVKLGRESGGRSEILAGLQEDEQIVLSGQFLLDSEASLAGVLVRAGEDNNGAGPQGKSPSRHEAHATVTALSETRVTLAHGPFTTLGMPGMTMSFPLANAHVAHGIAIGDEVLVVVSEQDDGLLVVELSKQEQQP